LTKTFVIVNEDLRHSFSERISSFDSSGRRPCRPSADDYRPTLTVLGALERELLDRFDGTQSAAARIVAQKSRGNSPAVCAGSVSIPETDDRALRLDCGEKLVE
jgi:hypothetical protein